MKNNLLLIICMFILQSISTAQISQLRSKIKVPASSNLKKKIKVFDCPKTIPAGYEVKDEFKFKNGEHDYTATIITPSAGVPTTTLEEKTISVAMPDLFGDANITVDEKDKTALSINFYLNPINTIPAGTQIQYVTNTFLCNQSVTANTRTARNLIADTVCYLFRFNAPLPAILPSWFTFAPMYIIVNDAAGNPLYYLVDKFDRDGDYSIKLRNREYISYRSTSFDLGPIVIPIKYRVPFKKNNISIEQEVIAAANLGIFGGCSWGRYRMRLEGNLYKDLSRVKTTVGGFVSFSTLSIDKTSTTGAEIPLTGDTKAQILILSYGLGVSTSIYNLNLGLYGGWDRGIGDYASRWNFDNKLWFGFGVSYGLSGFWKKE